MLLRFQSKYEYLFTEVILNKTLINVRVIIKKFKIVM